VPAVAFVEYLPVIVTAIDCAAGAIGGVYVPVLAVPGVIVIPTPLTVQTAAASVLASSMHAKADNAEVIQEDFISHFLQQASTFRP